MPAAKVSSENAIRAKIREIGETPIPLKHVVAIIAVTVLVIRPPRSWIVINSQRLHRV